ncbi:MULTISPECIES: VOC family protein [unclassified Nocardiopsis]|uniref:VOC family protein n=1 Tax=unclassified Nocardiopsis TaxID=2649073 RepID=UPI00135A7518|nr:MULTISPECIES: VOC family protein [unclassified Nocardiopsis]
MSRKTFVNLSAASLDATREFFSALGFEYDEARSCDWALCVAVNGDFSVLFLAEPYFADFAPSGVADPSAGNEVVTTLGADSRDEVDRMAEAAAVAGATGAVTAEQTGVYSRSFTDPDGHRWEFPYTDPEAAPS